MHKIWIVVFALLLSVAGFAKSNDYGIQNTWICKPGRRDACKTDLTATVITADGKMTKEKWIENPDPAIDCFYIYPTVSRQKTANANMHLDPIEKNVVRVQLARFGSQCRLFAPLYRQPTVTALLARLDGTPMKTDPELAYHDILDAWNYYLKHDNKGRGVVLLGHSMGTTMLSRLIREEIEGKPIQAQIVSAILLGGDIKVPKGKDVGGTFQHMPLCRSATQTGCIIAYNSFRSDSPPQPDLSSDTKTQALVSACTNPAALGGGSGELRAYLPATPRDNIAPGYTLSTTWLTPPKRLSTAFVTVPGMLTAECAPFAEGSYLAVTVHADLKGPRAKDITGDLILNGKIKRDWGLHLIDVDLALGNLVDIVAQQSKAYSESNDSRKPSPRARR